MNIDNNTKIFLGDREIVEVKRGGVTIWEKSSEPEDVDYLYIENTFEGNTYNTTNTINISKSSGGDTTGLRATTVEYSKDKNNWTTIDLSTDLPLDIEMEVGEKVYFRNDSGKWNYQRSATTYFQTSFKTSHECIVGGDLRTILNYKDIENVSLSQGCYSKLFKDCGMKSVPVDFLPATELAPYCYSNLFESCGNLVSPPELPATNLANNCYDGLFSFCTSLTSVPELPATELADYCYTAIFYGCSSLTSVPSDLLPATTLKFSCYNSAFLGCRSLTKAPILPAKTLTGYCYAQLFRDCSSLNEITIYADDISATDCIFDWLYGVATTGTFRNLGSATYTTDSESGIPTGWTEVRP